MPYRPNQSHVSSDLSMGDSHDKLHTQNFSENQNEDHSNE